MFQKAVLLIFIGWLSFAMCGCIAVVAGAAGGGTAVWLSGKLVQEVNVPYDRAIEAVRSALRSLRLEITKETKEKNIAQVMSKYTDGKTIWIDIRKVSDSSSQVAVRVGVVRWDREVADKILKRIVSYL